MRYIENKMILSRLVDDKNQTTGNLVFYNSIETFGHYSTLELAWHQNKVNISCIPAGRYILKVRNSEKHGRHLQVMNVKGRALILFHIANFRRNLKGCIGVGRNFKKIDKNDSWDITDSKSSMTEIMSHIKDNEEIELFIKDTLIYR